jgi:myo-inositol-1(or 4)-monophosphatase
VGQANAVRDRELLASCVAAAVRATDVLRATADVLPSLTWQEKSPSDFVSEADHAAEAAIREVLLARHPGATMIEEEASPGGAIDDAGLSFVVDPLDGTTNFLHGYPWYAVSIGALREGVVVAGAVLNVANGELFTATVGAGARRNGQPIAVSAIADPQRALIGTGFPFKHPHLVEPYMRQFPRLLTTTAGVRRAGAAALDLADVACGRFDGFWELMLAPWDIAAGILIVREAGGTVTDLAGADSTVSHTPLVASNGLLHPWLLATLAG